MGGGPKASAANLEPLGKRRRFETPTDTSSTKSCASTTRDVKSASEIAPAFYGAVDSRSAPLSGTAQAATSHTEFEDMEKPASTLVKSPGARSLPRSEPASLLTETDGYVGVNKQIEPSATAQTTRPVNRDPSPRTRRETSARALALAQEWQAKFKGLPKKTPVKGEQLVHVPGEQGKSGSYESQALPVEKSESQYHGFITTHRLDEEPSSERRRKNGPGPRASAANLEPLGKSKMGTSLQASIDGVSIQTGLHQQSYLDTTADRSAKVVQNSVAAPKAICQSRLMQNTPSLSTMAAPASDNHVVGGRSSTLAGRELTLDVVHGKRDVDKKSAYPSPPRNDTRLFTGGESTGKNDRSENTIRKRKRSPSPYRRRAYKNEAGHREDRIQEHESVRNYIRARNRSPANLKKEWNQAYPREAHPSRTSGVRDDCIPQSERSRDPASYQNERQGTVGYSYNDQHGETRIRDNGRPSYKRSNPYHRDRSTSPRRSYHERQNNRDYNRHRGDERRHRGENDLSSQNDIKRRSWTGHKGREYQHHDPGYSYDEVFRPAGDGRHESDRRQQPRSPDQFFRSGDRSGYRGHGINREPREHQVDQYTRNLHRH
jgi:hypothetical protein